MTEFIITFRETLEATLIIGILYTFYSKLNALQSIKTIWKATATAVLASGLFAYGLLLMKDLLKNSSYEKLFEAVLMYLAAGFLIYIVLCMKKNIAIKEKLEENVLKSLKYSQLTVFLLVFFAIVREGFETTLLLISSSQITSFSYIGFFGGILFAITIGFLVFKGGIKIPLKPFFNITSIILLLFAGGMIAYGTHEMEEFLVKTNTIDSQIDRVWNILKPTEKTPSNDLLYSFNESKQKYYHIFHDKGTIGVFLKGFFGYNSNPNYLEFFLWVLTLFSSFYFFLRKEKLIILKPK